MQRLGHAEEVRAADLVACREFIFQKKKVKIGVLCSGLTENPEEKIHNFKPLLEMLNDNEPGVYLTVRKLALVSLVEVFKDLLPEYQIKHHNEQNVKSVKQLQGYENNLLKYYKDYLKEIEKIVNVFKRKKGDQRIVTEAQVKLAETALKCLCDVFNSHQYFNFSKNIVHLIVPFLNNGRETIRKIVSEAIKTLFKTDKKGAMSLEAVRNINKFVKSKRNIVHNEVLNVLLSLNLKDVSLDKEKEEEIRKKKEEAKRSRMIQLSKREKKRIKKSLHLQNDLLETKAEENRKFKEQCLTEVTKIIFTIYFRILKENSSSKLLKGALEGVAKFAHCINVEFYQDLIIVLDQLIQNENLNYQERLCCVWTVFTVLYYQGATIYIDPVRFYSHFYTNILEVNSGINHSDLPVILKTTNFILLKRRQHLSLQRLLAFTKRLTTLALQVLPNGSLAVLSLIGNILQVNSSTDILLELESAQGQGIYFPEMEEPEYCNAFATSLWELLLLQKHYHPSVRDFAVNIAKLAVDTGDNNNNQKKSFIKLSPEQYFEVFSPDTVKFNPAIPPPRKFPKVKRKGEEQLLNPNLEEYVNEILKKVKFKF
uniref:NOC3-like protein n=1 Tax=Pediculus humanus subsp. corporis TaxID=121224 RepID=A0A2Y9D417_PEDHC